MNLFNRKKKKPEPRVWRITDPVKVRRVWELYDVAVSTKSMAARFDLWAYLDAELGLPFEATYTLQTGTATRIIVKENLP